MIAAVRIRGVPDVRRNTHDTLKALRLHRKNNCTLVPDNEVYRGMLVEAKDYIAYGEVSEETMAALLRKRGSVEGRSMEDALDDLGYDSIEAVVSALAAEEVTLPELHDAGLNLPFRLSPPSKGYKGSKEQYNQGGSLGKRDDMDALLARMI